MGPPAAGGSGGSFPLANTASIGKMHGSIGWLR
jgi:hypothetical protein